MELEDFKLIEGKNINGELVELSKKSLANGIYESTLTDCEIVLDPRGVPASRFGSRFYMQKDVLERCVIRAKGSVNAFNVAESVFLKHCKFVGGPFKEAVFGSGTLSSSKDVELLEGCDFTECDLRDARFYRTSIQQVMLPRWPHITVVARDGDQFYTPPSEIRPAFSRLHDEVSAFDWADPDMARSLAIMVYAVGERPHTPTIEVCHAEDVIRRGGGTVELLRAELDRFAHPAIRY